MVEQKIIQRLKESPELYEFCQLMRILKLDSGQFPGIRTLLFDRLAPDEVVSLKQDQEKHWVTTNLTCLNGPKGILPHYFQDALRQTSIERQDGGFFAFVEQLNASVLLKRFFIDRYSSLPMMVEAILDGGAEVSDFFLDFNGLFTWPLASGLTMLRYHSRLKMETSHSIGIDRVLSDYFSLPISIQRGHLLRQALTEESQWQLGRHDNSDIRLGQAMLLGCSAMLSGAEISMHVAVVNQSQWQRLQRDQELVNALHAMGRLLLRADPLLCWADVSCEHLSAPRLGQGFRLGQYQVLRPDQCHGRTVSVRLNPTKEGEIQCLNTLSPDSIRPW